MSPVANGGAITQGKWSETIFQKQTRERIYNHPLLQQIVDILQ